MKIGSLVTGVVAAAALWSAGWYAGRALYVEPRVDQSIEAFRAGPATFSYRTRDIGGFPFSYDVVFNEVAIGGPAAAWRWETPQLLFTTGLAGFGDVVAAPSAQTVFTISADATGAPEEVYDLTTERLRIEVAPGPDGWSAALDAARAVSRDGAVVLTVEGGASGAARQSDEGLWTMSGRAGEVAVTSRASPDGVRVRSTSQRMTAPVVSAELNPEGFDARDVVGLIVRGGAARFELDYDRLVGEITSTGGPSAAPFSTTFNWGASRNRLTATDGRLDYEVTSGPGEATVSLEGAGRYAAALGEMRFSLSAPYEPAPGPQTWSIALETPEITFSEATWAGLDPAGVFERAPISLVVETSGDLRIFAPLIQPETPTAQPPLDLETLRLDNLAVSGFGVEVTGSGAFEVAGDAAQPIGAAEVRIAGLTGALARAEAAGLITAPAMAVYQRLAQTILRPAPGDDVYTATIERRRSGVFVNGQQIQ